MSNIVVAAFYKFTPLPDFEDRQEALLAAVKGSGALGTILLASEGVNGTIAGAREAIDKALTAVKSLPGCADLEWKESYTDENPFYRIKVRLKKEIVALGVEGLQPEKSHERYVKPHDWNAVISDPETLVIDTRNDYEVAIGAFEGAIDPETTSFREFPEWFREFRKTHDVKRVAMYCTGGIRCEKSVAFVRSEGIEDVFHLRGGILKYLETVKEADSLWQGECFVFDQRVSVGHDLEPGSYDMCHACRQPITEDDKAAPEYVKGVSCPNCHGVHSERKKQALEERQRQIDLAKARGETHIGVKQS